MKYTLTIDCDNEAFSDNLPGEVGRILREAVGMVESGGCEVPGPGKTFGKSAFRSLRDVNGNTVGQAGFVAD